MIVEGVAKVARKLNDNAEVDAEESHLTTESRDDGSDEDIDIDALASEMTKLSHTDDSNSFEVKVPKEEIVQTLLSNVDYSQYSDLSQSDLAVVVSLSLMFKSGMLDTRSKEPLALLSHTSVLRECSLSERAVKLNGTTASNPFLRTFTEAAKLVLASSYWKSAMSNSSARCDLADLIDGRLFFHFLGEAGAHVSSEPSVISKFNGLASLLQHLCGVLPKPELLEGKIESLNSLAFWWSDEVGR